jgi:hypothetical protein
MRIPTALTRPLTTRTIGSFVAVALGASLVVAPAPSSSAAARWNRAGIWGLNESRGASVAHDASGHGLDATIGRKVRTGLTSGKRTYVRFPKAGVRRGPNPGRLLLVDDSRWLDPRRGRFRVAVSLRTKANGANIVQKGQATAPGGYWKMEINSGRAVCLFRGGNGAQAGVGSARRIDDGRWHRIVCTRSARRAVMRVDGHVTSVRHKSSGRISNSRPFSVGGKPHCGGAVECDFFVGGIDYVRVWT